MSERLAKRRRRALGCPTLADLDRWLGALARTPVTARQSERIDRITALEKLKSAAAAAQARETVAFKKSRIADEHAAGVRLINQGRGVAGEIALARRESRYRGSRLVGLADALVSEMPNTMAALTRGDLSEWRATLVARETACLSVEDRREVDLRLAGRLASMSDAHLVAEARRHAYALDPYGFLNRGRRAAADRHVSSRPAPDTMTRVSALLPAAQGVAVIAALGREAERCRAAGDPRSRGQVMADTFVERLTGQTAADQTPVEIQLVMTDRSLFNLDPTPGLLHGYGPVPAPEARALLAGLDTPTKAWIRRLLTDPVTGRLAALDSHRRLFAHTRRRALIIRDQLCRTPWCGAPIRHADHAHHAATGGRTTEANGQGLCEACNYTKEAPGWQSKPDPAGGGGASVTITTPTGHSYTSRPPPLPGSEWSASLLPTEPLTQTPPHDDLTPMNCVA